MVLLLLVLASAAGAAAAAAAGAAAVVLLLLWWPYGGLWRQGSWKVLSRVKQNVSCNRFSSFRLILARAQHELPAREVLPDTIQYDEHVNRLAFSLE